MAKKKAHELTDKQVMRRIFHRFVRDELKKILAEQDAKKKARKAKNRKSMKGR